MRAEKEWLTCKRAVIFPISTFSLISCQHVHSDSNGQIHLWSQLTYCFSHLGFLGEKKGRVLDDLVGEKASKHFCHPANHLKAHNPDTFSKEPRVLEKLVKSSSQRVWADCQWVRANECFKDSTVLAELGLNQAREDLCIGQESHKRAMQLLDTCMGLFKRP